MPGHSNRPASHPLGGLFVHRFVSAILLRRELFEAVAADPNAGRPAAAVVCLSALAQHSVGPPTSSDFWLAEVFGTWALLVVMLVAIIRWAIFSAVMYAIARLIESRRASYLCLLRCLGFASAPALLIWLALIDQAALFTWMQRCIGLWLLAATVVAVRAALNLSTARAIPVGVLGFALYLALPIVAQAILLFMTPHE